MTEAEDNRPEWMIELENRKRKPRLAHEAGAGSPCLSCKEACPGLDLHFWRKICKNCKCARDEHDVVDDEFPQFDLLLGPSGRPRKQATFLPVASRKQPEKVHAFDWIPPDVTTELAADYMKALPENKLPIQGSAGAALRKQQLQKQLPLHDMDHKACDKLSEHEKQQFEKYLENLKKYVGQGRVSKVTGARPFSMSLMTPANAADMQPMSPQRKPQVYSAAGESANLRTPSSFIPKVSGVSPAQGSQMQQTWLAANMEAIHAQISENANSTGVRLGQYHPVLDNVSAAGQLASSELVISNRHPAHQFANSSHITEGQQNVNPVLRKPENAQYIPDFGKVNYHQTEFSQTGEQFEPGSAPVSVTPINNPDIDGPVTLNESSHLPHQQIPSLENLQTSWNVSYGSLIESGKYHGQSNLSSSHAAEPNQQGDNLGTLRHAIPGRNAGFEDEAKELQLEGSGRAATDPSMAEELRDIGRVMQNVSLSDDIPLTNAQLAEQMLSDALLPPSAVHANEIIGSSLDRNRLRYIQQKLSAKYSKDDPPSQQLFKSQRTDRVDPQYGQSIGEHKNSQTQDPIFGKEANRAAIIAAMRNPSGLLADKQRLDKIGAEYANPLGQSDHNEDRDSLVPPTNTSEEPSLLTKANSMEYNEKYPTISPLIQQGSTAKPLDSTPQSDTERNKLLKPNQILNRPTQYQYSNAILSSADPLSGIHEQQQRILNVDPHWSQKLDKSGTGTSHPHGDNVPERPALADQPLSHHPEAAVPTLEQISLDNTGAMSDNKKNFANTSSAFNSEQLRAELNYQPVNSHLIHSESLSNPLFPEGIIDSPGLRQNPASVDQLRGALEELAAGPIQLQKCTECKEEIRSGDVVVTAERAEDAIWHPGCFICSTCNELLVDLVYFYHKGKLYCGRDLATLLNIPRCFACDELIFVREYTVAEGHNYHVKHFCCWDCDMPLAGQQYISENDRPLCLPCYQKTYAKTCKTCNEVIAADQQGVAVKNLDFHANDQCFCCFTCKKSLLSGKMAIKEDRPFCSKECITAFLSNKP